MAESTTPDAFEQRAVRVGKRQEIIDSGSNPYPAAASADALTPINMLVDTYSTLPVNHMTDDFVTVIGRVMSARHAGKISFVVLQAGRGARLQILVSRAIIGDDVHASMKRLVDRGDFISVSGLVGTSMTGELSVFAQSYTVVSKALRPLPNTFDDLNEETRVRQPYLSLIVDDVHRTNMVNRSKVISDIRAHLTGDDYLEVETPILQTMHGGASARPFVTHGNAIDSDLYLRIAPELFLKRAIVGGLDRVFEINKNFRNEGMDSTHSPEFTMLEAYEVHADYNGMAELTESLIGGAASVVDGLDDERRMALSVLPFDRISLYVSLSEFVGESITPDTSMERLTDLATAYGVRMDVPTHGKLVEELWEATVKPALVRPTFVFDYPVDSSPLVASHRSIAGVVEKWDLYIDGFEIATGYSELVDPIIQRERLVAQSALSGRGDDEAMGLDESFLTALEYGMPPTGGIGLGIDRLMMVLFGTGIRETVLFPLVK